MRLIDNKASLSPRQERAASLVVDDRLSDEQIATQTGITKRTLERWKQKPAFCARVEEIRRAVKRALNEKGIAEKANRIAALVERHNRMQEIIDARAIEHADVPGGSTGLLVKTVRLIKVHSTTEDGQLQPTGERIEIVEYAVDVGLLREMSEIEKQCAIEMGEWQRTIGQKLNIDLERFTDEQLERVAAGEDPRLVRLRALLGRVEPANEWKN